MVTLKPLPPGFRRSDCRVVASLDPDGPVRVISDGEIFLVPRHPILPEGDALLTWTAVGLAMNVIAFICLLAFCASAPH